MAKRIWAVILAAIMLFACSAAVFATGDDLEIMPATFAIGDVNMDKSVNIKDATAVQKYIAMLENLSDIQLFLADADLDGDVNIKDATYIQKQVAGLVKPAVPTMPVETSAVVSTEVQATVTETATQPATDETEVTTTENVPETTVTTPAETTPSAPLTDPTEEPATVTEVTETTEQTEETTAQATTCDPNKPIELPFIPAK